MKLLVGLIFLFPLVVIGQKAPIKFGDVSVEDLKMTHYSKDSSAAAVVLADYGESSITYSQEDGFILGFERIRRIKILKKEGFEWADFSIPLYHSAGDEEKLAGLKAVTYNFENGKIIETKVKNDAVFKEKYDNNLDVMKITFPNVKEGSIIEIFYKINSDFLFNFQDWEFQATIPTVLSEYRAKIPEYFHYDKYMQGYISLNINEQTQASATITLTSKEREGDRSVQTTYSTEKINYIEQRFRWAANDVPAFKAEPFITTARDYISRINFELSFTQYPGQPIKRYMGSWEDINKQYAESSEFGQEVAGNGFLKKTVEEITGGKTSPEEKITAINNYVKQQVEWDGTNRRFISKSLKKTIEDRKGSSAEINLLLASMIDKADIKVYPVLLSTRDHGFVREEIPISSQFNYVICLAQIGDKPILLDATDRLLPTGMIPERCLNGKGFLVSKEGFRWINLQPASRSKTMVNAEFSLTEAGDLTGKLQFDRGGYDGHLSRKAYASKKEDEYVKEFVGSKPWEITRYEFQNVKSVHEPLKEIYEVNITQSATVAGTIIYINPILLYRMDENPFKLEKREYPVDFSSPFERLFLCRITIPENLQVDELPTPKVIALPGNAARYTYSVTQSGKILNIVSNFQVNRSIFSQTEYPDLREFYNQVVAKQAEQIVLKAK